jgi:hypothetical protein
VVEIKVHFCRSDATGIRSYQVVENFANTERTLTWKPNATKPSIHNHSNTWRNKQLKLIQVGSNYEIFAPLNRKEETEEHQGISKKSTEGNRTHKLNEKEK